MTKQLARITPSDLISSPLFKTAVGFDSLLNDLWGNPAYSTSSSGFPPYNLAKLTNNDGETYYEITMALAGFKEENIDIFVENNELKVSGSSAGLYDGEQYSVEYLHQGIAERNFSRSFRLADHVEVRSAELKDGMLRITLEQTLPEELKPKRIEINA
jgi:molecular chaperone IbpA